MFRLCHRLLLNTTAAATAAAEARPPPKYPLKSAQHYMSLTNAELEELLKKRDDQLSELKLLHEKSHSGVEYVHRRQLLDWEEHGVHYAQAAGVMTGDVMLENRWYHVDVRKKDDSEDRDRWIVMALLTFATLVYWYYLSKHYRERPDAPRGRQLSGMTMWGWYPFGWAGTTATWVSRNVDTQWEADQKNKVKLIEKERFPREQRMAVKKQQQEEVAAAPAVGEEQHPAAEKKEKS